MSKSVVNIDQPLINHAVCLQAPLALVGEAIRKQLPDARIKAQPSAHGESSAFMGALSLPDIQVAYVDYGQAVQVQCANHDDYAILWVEKGNVVIHQSADERIAHEELHFLRPGAPLDIFFAEDAPHLLIRLPRQTARRDVLDRVFQDSRQQHSPILQEALVRVLRMFLDSQRHVVSHKDGLNSLQDLRDRLYALFEANLEGSPIGLPDMPYLDPRIRKVANFLRQEQRWEYDANLLCDMAGMSLRGLYYAFERALGSTPYRYHRAQKLIRVRAALLADQNHRHPIAWHATNEGFYHLSRFAAQYRTLFGELPSETLQNMRSLQHPLSLNALTDNAHKADKA